MANVVLPEVSILNNLANDTNLLVEQSGKINRFAVTDLISEINSAANPIDADTLNGYKFDYFASQDNLDEAIANIGLKVELNYSVVGGTTQPIDPTENMIWINTDKEITDYIFSKNEPKNPIQNMVWIYSGENSSVAFHSLNINGKKYDEIFPLSAKQYVSDAWVDKTAKSYQGGAWVDWVLECYLYNSGNQCSNITGGWGKNGWTWDGNADLIQGLTINSDHIRLAANPPSYVAAAGTSNKVDLSQYSSLEVLYDMDKGSGCINITSSKAANIDSGYSLGQSWFNETGVQTATISLEGIDEDAYICVFSDSLNTIIIHKVLLKL